MRKLQFMYTVLQDAVQLQKVVAEKKKELEGKVSMIYR